jgi:NADH-quinone oxidoreductase subunit C
MTTSEIHALLQQQFDSAVSATEPTVVDVARLMDVSRFLKEDPRLRFDFLNNISGVDYLETDTKKVAKAGFEPHLEVVYHLSSLAFPGRRFTFKLILPRWKDGIVGELPEVPSVASLWRTADWHEREVYDLVGIRFTGHPDLRRILMADDWIGHPLRKDFEYPLEYHDIRCR